MSREIASVSEQVQTLESSLTEKITDSVREVESSQAQQLHLVKQTVAGVGDVVNKLAQDHKREVQMLKSSLDSQRETIQEIKAQGTDSEEQKEKIQSMATVAITKAMENVRSQLGIENSISAKNMEDIIRASKEAALEVVK